MTSKNLMLNGLPPKKDLILLSEFFEVDEHSSSRKSQIYKYVLKNSFFVVCEEWGKIINAVEIEGHTQEYCENRAENWVLRVGSFN